MGHTSRCTKLLAATSQEQTVRIEQLPPALFPKVEPSTAGKSQDDNYLGRYGVVTGSLIPCVYPTLPPACVCVCACNEAPRHTCWAIARSTTYLIIWRLLHRVSCKISTPFDPPLFRLSGDFVWASIVTVSPPPQLLSQRSTKYQWSLRILQQYYYY